MTALEDLAKPEVLSAKSLGGLEVKPVDQALEYINLFVYGDPGAGKTVLAGSAGEIPEMSPVLVLDIEGGTMSIRKSPNVDVVRVKTWKEVQKVYDALYSGDHPYKTVVIDSLSEAQKFSMGIIMQDVVLKDSTRDPDIPSVREWGKNIEQIRLLARAIRDLEMNAIITALKFEDKDPRTGMWKTRPGLPGKLSGEVAGFYDIVGYMYNKVKGEEVRRLMLTTATDTQIAKDRSGNLPMVVEDPTMPKLYRLMFGEQ